MGFRALILPPVLVVFLLCATGAAETGGLPGTKPPAIGNKPNVSVTAPTVKPTTPVKVSLQPQSQPKAGQAVEFVVRAVSDIATFSLIIIVQTPLGAVVQSGALVWEGAANAGETKTLRVLLLLPAQGGTEVSAVARIRAPNGAQLAARAVYRDNSGAVAASLGKSRPRSVLRNSRAVAEYPLQ